MGRIQDETDLASKTEELADLYRTFLSTQYAIIKEWFGEERMRRAFDRGLCQLSPGLQEVFGKYHFTEVVGSNRK